MHTATCQACETKYPHNNDDPGQPCPSCGSTFKTVRVSISAGVVVSDHVSATATEGKRIVAFSESEGTRYTRFGHRYSNGTIRLALRGRPPQNEDDSEQAVRQLLAYFRKIGIPMIGFDRGKGDDDFLLWAERADQPIGVQVVRAHVDPAFWRNLAHGEHRVELLFSSAEEAARLVANAILHKAVPIGIPRKQRSSMILLLDAQRLPALALDDVRERVPRLVRGTNPTPNGRLGFYRIYVVGPDWIGKIRIH